MIILNDKDADEVANFCRQKLKMAEDSYHEAFVRMSKLKNASDSFLSEEASDEERDKFEGEINTNFEYAKAQLEKDWNEIKNTYTRIIKLMVCGSEKLGE